MVRVYTYVDYEHMFDKEGKEGIEALCNVARGSISRKDGKLVCTIRDPLTVRYILVADRVKFKVGAPSTAKERFAYVNTRIASENLITSCNKKIITKIKKEDDEIIEERKRIIYTCSIEDALNKEDRAELTFLRKVVNSEASPISPLSLDVRNPAKFELIIF